MFGAGAELRQRQWYRRPTHSRDHHSWMESRGWNPMSMNCCFGRLSKTNVEEKQYRSQIPAGIQKPKRSSDVFKFVFPIKCLSFVTHPNTQSIAKTKRHSAVAQLQLPGSMITQKGGNVLHHLQGDLGTGDGVAQRRHVSHSGDPCRRK